jgi:hypothetical protein
MMNSLASALLMTLAAAAQPPERAPWVVYEPNEGPGDGRHIVFVAGDEEYRSEEALPMLARILAERHGFRCTVLFSQDAEGKIDPEARGNLPGLGELEKADLLVLFTRFRELPDKDMRWIVDYVNDGRPLIGIRTATHAFAYGDDSESRFKRWGWNNKSWKGGFGKQILGETWVAHHGKHGSESTRGVIPEAVSEHAILRGVKDVWGPTDVYSVRGLPSDAVVLLEGSVRAGMTPDAPAVEDERNAPRMPIVWAREIAQLETSFAQRVLCSTIGAATDFESEDLRRLFVNACYWSTRIEAKIPERADVAIVGEYEPTPFGFGKYVRGRRPENHEIEKDDSKDG